MSKKDDTSPTIEQRLEEAFSNLSNKRGSPDAAGVLLLQENKAYRDEIAALKAEMEKLREQAITPDQQQRLDAYQQLGDPGEIQKQRQEIEKLQRRELYRQAADVHGYKAAVLGHLLDGVDVAIKDSDDGKAAVVVEGDKEIPLPDYVQSQWADFVPALKPVTAEDPAPRWPAQRVGDTPGKRALVDNFLKQKQAADAAKTNPLMRQK